MKTRVLHYATGRDDKIVATYKEVTFIGKHVGWYVDAKDERHENWDNIAIVERIDGICFVAEFLSRNSAFDKEHLAAVAAEARNLRAAMQERIAQKQWIPLTYIAAYEALGWDARPLKEHRAYMRALRMAEDRPKNGSGRRLCFERRKRFEMVISSRLNFSSGCAASMESRFIPGRSGYCESGLHECLRPIFNAEIVVLARPRWTDAAG